MSVVAYPLNNTDYTAEDAMLYNCSRTSGVLDEDGNLEISVTDDRKVTVGVGIAWIRYKKLAGLAVGVRGAEILSIAVSSATLSRIDTVVLGYSAADNGASLYIKQGTPSSTPTHPALTKSESLYELGLYDIKVAAGSTTVSASDITDTRGDDDRCGYMREIGAALLRTLDDYAKLNSPSFKGGITVDGKITGNGDAAVSGALTVGGKSTFSGAAAFTQSPTVPTADKTDNTTKAASTAFVHQVAGGGTRKLVATFNSSGSFNPASYPSIGNKYDIEMCGGGMGGGPRYSRTQSSKVYYMGSPGGQPGETIKAYGVYIGASVAVEIGAGGAKNSIEFTYTSASTGIWDGAEIGAVGGDTTIKALGLIAKGGGYNAAITASNLQPSVYVGMADYLVNSIPTVGRPADESSNATDSAAAGEGGKSLMSPYGDGGAGASDYYSYGQASNNAEAGTSGIVKIYAYQ